MKPRRWLRKSLVAAGAAVLVLVCACGCDYLEKRRIERTLNERAKFLAGGDAKGYFSFFSGDYSDPFMAFDRMRDQTSERLKKTPPPTVSFGKRQISIKGDQAMVVERFILEDKIEGRARRYDEIQHLVLARTPRGWECRRGSEVLKLLSGRMQSEYEIEQVLLRREAALVKEDIRSYMSLISPRYRHKGDGPEDLKQKLLQIFRVYDDIDFRSYDRKIRFQGDAVTVTQKFTMHAVQMGKSMTFTDEERFELELTEDGWKFSKGL